MDQKENSRLLGEWLGKRYHVAFAEGEESLEVGFDLCIVDGPALDRSCRLIQDRKKKEDPAFLPILLVTPRQDVGVATRHLWKTVDDLILIPIEKIELHARVEILLRARRYSVESEERYYALAEQSPLGIFILHNDRIVYANRSLRRILDMSDQELESAAFLDRFNPESREDVRAYCSKVMNEEGILGPCELSIRGKGERIWLELHMSVISWCGERALLGVMQDISRRKHDAQERERLFKEKESYAADLSAANERLRSQTAELIEQRKALAKAHDELEAKVRERTKALQESNQALQDFASIASHDLQEPLRKVSVFGSVLQSKYGDALGGNGREYVERMLSATGRMQSLITSLLDYSRLDTKAQSFVEVKLNDVVKEVLADLEVRIHQSGGRVETEDLPIVQADPTQMHMLFQNLIANGLKFHKENEKPFVKVTARCQKENCLICVEDNGIGFDEQYLEKIFAPFQRLHGNGSPYEGTGIGLAICRKIVERHGGKITARSTPGKGSTFIVTLPARQ
jgi:PAS domain S-box-containing protein